MRSQNFVTRIQESLKLCNGALTKWSHIRFRDGEKLLQGKLLGSKSCKKMRIIILLQRSNSCKKNLANYCGLKILSRNKGPKEIGTTRVIKTPNFSIHMQTREGRRTKSLNFQINREPY